MVSQPDNTAVPNLEIADLKTKDFDKCNVESRLVFKTPLIFEMAY